MAAASGNDPTQHLHGCRDLLARAEAQLAESPEKAATLFAQGYSGCERLRGPLAYGLAASFAALGRPGLGLSWLTRAVDEGFWDLGSIESDPRIEKIRRMRRYKKVFPSLRARIRKERAGSLPVNRIGASPRGATTGVLVLLHPDGGSALEMLEAFEKKASAVGLVCAAPDAPVALGRERRLWGELPDARRRIQEAEGIARLRRGGRGTPLFLAGAGAGARIALAYALLEPSGAAGVLAFAMRPDPVLVGIVELARRLPPALFWIPRRMDPAAAEQSRRIAALLSAAGAAVAVRETEDVAPPVEAALHWIVERRAVAVRR